MSCFMNLLFQIDIHMLMCMCKCCKRRLQCVKVSVSEDTSSSFSEVFCAKLLNNQQTFGSTHADTLQENFSPVVSVRLTSHNCPWPQQPFFGYPALISQGTPYIQAPDWLIAPMVCGPNSFLSQVTAMGTIVSWEPYNLSPLSSI